MRRSSESVGALAAALAKAQAELTNPEKSLVATLPVERGQQQRSFRYAPLSGGLDIVRKTLGRHEIATIQATAIDRDSGTIQLTTTLAHASGEWIASDWPVCALADLPAPHRMGAALTYARRYALFTLVGIAGEDDLDAPDLPKQDSGEPGTVSSFGEGRTNSEGRSFGSPQDHNGRRHKRHVVRIKPLLSAEASAALRERLFAEIAALTSPDDVDSWAVGGLSAKNTLTTVDAGLVEEAFTARLLQVTGIPIAANTEVNSSGVNTARDYIPAARPRRRRDKIHRRFVSAQACVVCGRQPSDAHHLRFAQVRALGRKVSDEFTVPLCRSHHRELHRAGDEVRWWARFGIDPIAIADKLWSQTHPIPMSEAGAAGPN
jgi:hypothetical protein